MYTVYQHRRLDTNEIFYIGIGSDSRPYWKHQRNNWWTNITNKTEYSVEILLAGVSKEQAIYAEKYLISYYGRKDIKTGCLVNLTDGGEGIEGFKFTEKSKAKMSEAKKEYYKYNLHKYSGVFGVNHPSFGYRHTDEIKKRLSLSKIESNNPMYNKKGALCPNSKKVIDTSTGVVYDSCTIAANKIGIGRKNLSRKLAGSRPNDTTLKYF